MKKYLVIGNPIEHSFSPLIHNHWMKKNKLINSIYEKKKIEKLDLKNIVNQIKNDELKGINVTVPFKKEIIPFLDDLDTTAKITESVNTVLKVRNNIIGYNTDSQGFSLTIQRPLIEKHIFILGAGGVTASIIYALKNDKAKIFVSNRTKEKAKKLKKKFSNIEVLNWGQKPKKYDIIINTTSVGLKKDERINIDFSDCGDDKNRLFYDLIYNPKETNFLREARLRGNKTMNGKMMFLNQAKYAFNLWTKITPKIDNEVLKLLDI